MSRLFNRETIFQLENLEIKMPGLIIEFSIKFNTEDEGNVGEITFYNLADKTLNQLEKDKEFKLISGYKEHKGVILPGIIKKTKTQWDEVDKVTTLLVGDNTDKWLTTTINKTWKAGKTAKDIAPQIIKKTGLDIGEININKNVTYSKGKTFSTTCKKALKEIAKDTETKLHSSRGKVYLRPKDISNNKAILLNSNTGLISSPEKIDDSEDGKKYSVQSFLNYKIQSDSLVKIESKTITGNYRVVEGEHSSSEGSHVTKMEVKALE